MSEKWSAGTQFVPLTFACQGSCLEETKEIFGRSPDGPSKAAVDIYKQRVSKGVLFPSKRDSCNQTTRTYGGL